MSNVNEMGMGAGTGFQLPLGVKSRKEDVDEMIRRAGDINEAHLMVFLSEATAPKLVEFYDNLDLMSYNEAADMVREGVVRQVIRNKINEVVRKKAGGGGYVLYAPNKGKKKHSKPVAAFPTRLAAKRAELARFPPKDPKKLQRLRKEIEKLLKDPKKRAEAERRALKARGTDIHHHAGKARGKHYESKILAKIIVNDVKRNLFAEGLFREEAPPNEWDEKMKQLPAGILKSDKKLQKILTSYEEALSGALKKSLKIIQKSLGAHGKVKPKGFEKHKDGRQYAKFSVLGPDASEIGPFYVYAKDGALKIEDTDDAKSALTSLAGQQMNIVVRGALAHAEDEMSKIADLKTIQAQRDAYMSSLERGVDTDLTKMSPLKLATIKRTLAKKFKGKI